MSEDLIRNNSNLSEPQSPQKAPTDNSRQNDGKKDKPTPISELYEVGDFIDAKDNQGDWRVGYIVDKNNQTKIFKVRFDGWASKYDEHYRFGHPKLKEFRSYVIGYTGQKQNPAVRDGWKFSMKKLEDNMSLLHSHIKAKKSQQQTFQTAHQYNQFIRGKNYFYIDFLIANNYPSVEVLHKVMEYLKLNLRFVCEYLQHVASNTEEYLKAIEVDQFQYIQHLEDAQNFAFYEVFDLVSIIMCQYPRQGAFFRDNDELLRQQFEVSPKKNVKTAYQISMTQYFMKSNGFALVASILQNFNELKYVSENFLFLYSLAHLYSAISINIEPKSKEVTIKMFKKIAQKHTEAIQSKNMKDFNQQGALDFISQIEEISTNTPIAQQISEWALLQELEIYYKMIMCPYFEKKLKGLTLLYEFLEQHEDLVLNRDQTDTDSFVGWLEKKNLLETLYSSDNAELIKKSTEIVKFLYSRDNSLQRFVKLVWRSREGKHETALKQIYQFIGDIPISDKGDSFTLELYENCLSRVEEKDHDIEYIKMLKEFTVNALFSSIQSINPKSTFGLNIIYRFMMKNNNYTDGQLMGYLIQVLEKLESTNFIDTFAQDCFLHIQKESNEDFHVCLLLRMLKQKIAEIRNLQKIDVRSIVQNNIVKYRNSTGNKAQQSIQQRFELMTQILKQAKEVIPLQDFIEFWEAMVSSKNSSWFFMWLYKVRDSGRIAITNYIQSETKQYLLETFWTEQYFEKGQISKQFGKHQALFLVELFKVVNFNHDRIRRANVIIKVLNENLIGLDKLYTALQHSQDQQASLILARGLVEVYMSVDDQAFSKKQIEEVDPQEIQSDENTALELNEHMADKKVEFVNSFINRISLLIQDYVKENNFEGIRKMILLMEEMINRDEEQFHVHQTVRSCIFKEFNIKHLETNEERVFRYNYSQTFYNLKKVIGEKFGLPLYEFDVLNNGQVITPDNYFKTMVEIGVLTKLTLTSRDNLNNATSAKNLLNKELELLFELLGNREIEERVWNIVTKLPISDELRHKITEAKNPIAVLESKSIYKELYMFKVCLTLKEQWWNSITPQKAIEIFTEKLMKRVSGGKTEIEREYLMVTLKIIETILTVEEKKNIKVVNLAFTNALKTVKMILKDTIDQENANPIVLKKIIESTFNIGQKYNLAISQEKDEKAQDAFSIILSGKDPKELITLGLIQHKIDKVRREFSLRMVKLTLNHKERLSKPLLDTIFNDLLEYCVSFQAKSQLRQFFNFSVFILESMNAFVSGFLEDRKTNLYNRLFNLIEQEGMEESSETVNNALYGYLSLMRFVAQELSDQETLIKLFDYVYQECLFKGKFSKCKSKDSRSAVFSLLLRLFRKKNVQRKGIQTFQALHRNGLWRTRKLEDWVIYQADRLKSSTGYTGLKNLGCTCYMNSYFQQIFMVEQFRLGLLLCEDPSFDINDVKNNVLYQVKKMFLSLMNSDKKAYNTKSFCFSFKDYEGNPTNVSEQMDIDQFSGILCDRLQNAIKDSKYENLIKDTFGGIYSNEIICKGCPHFSEREESFSSVTLTVKDKKNIYESLETMIKGDYLDGDNAYYCERCDKKVSAVKRVCLKTLPNHLFLTLKRFEFDYQTMTKLKVNDFCEFPSELNLKEYSYEHLRLKENPKAFEGQQLENLKSDSYFEYRLKGVVVHLGYADSGHYYSLIKERSGQQRWLEFNDTTVRKFNYENLADECFGGETGGIDSKEKIKNAYMLLYERVEKIEDPKYQGLSRVQGQIEKMEEYKQIFEEIHQDNIEYKIESILFSAEYVKFMGSLIDEAAKDKEKTLNLQKFIITMYLTTIVRSRSDPGFWDLIQRIHPLFVEGNSEVCNWILQQFCDHRIFEEFFRNNPVKEVKKILAFWTLDLFKHATDKEVKHKLLQLIILKIAVTKENIQEVLMFLYYLADSNEYIQIFREETLVAKLIDNFTKQFSSKNQEKDKKSLTEFNEQIPESEMGHQIIIERTAFEQRKYKYDNENGSAWSVMYKVLSAPYESEEEKKADKIRFSSCVQKLIAHNEKWHQIIEQVRGKFEIDALTNLLAFLCKENKQFTQRIITAVELGIRDYPSKKYRQLFVLYDKLIRINDPLKNERILSINNVIRSLKENEKYAMDCTIIQLWFCKLVNENQFLREGLMKEKHIIDYLANLPLKKVPSDELAKKNAKFQDSSVNKYHGIPYPRSRRGYTRVLDSLELFYHKMSEGIFEPLSLFVCGNHVADQDLKAQQQIAYFDAKDTVQFEEMSIQKIFLNRLQLVKKKQDGAIVGKPFWAWKDDEKLTKDLKAVRNQNQYDLDSSKTTEMDEDLEEYYAV